MTARDERRSPEAAGRARKGAPKGTPKGTQCGVCGRSFARHDLTPIDLVRPALTQRLDAQQPDWRRTGFICRTDLAAVRRAHVEDMLREERGELTRLDQTVLESLADHETLTSDIHNRFAEKRDFGDRLADRVAAFGGSWRFIIGFATVIVLWMGFNTILLFAADQFDPYPYILLNLVLSCVAAFQAPLIMMSQRRQESKDRLRAENDYLVNLKAELEIRQLHEKLDHLLIRQWERLTEIQGIQLELLEDLGRGRGR